MNDIAVIIPNYNMPEAIQVFEHVLESQNVDLIVVDNGSDLFRFKEQQATLTLPENVQTCKGWLAGFAIAEMFEALYEKKYFAFVFGITSAVINYDYDYIEVMSSFLKENENAVGIMPSLNETSTIDVWHHMKNRGDVPRRVFGLDSIFTMWRADWFKENKFDPDFYYAWGTGEEISWKARRDGRSLWVHDGLQMMKVQDIGYNMNRMNMTSEERRELAWANVSEVMERKYGDNWMWRMNNEFVDEVWR